MLHSELNCKKKRILLVTLPGNYNIGNRLQNYALQTMIERYGFDVDNLWIEEKISLERKVKDCIKQIIPPFNQNLKISKKHFKRTKRIANFTDAYIHNIRRINISEINSKDWSQYFLGVTGSDQVWHNTAKSDKELEYYYLSFLPEYKRISYAPSFGFSQFSNEDIHIHKRGLLEMRGLSCRESDGCEMIHELCGRSAKLVLDPTFLLCDDDWREISKKPLKHECKKYILTYFLGELTDDVKYVIGVLAKRESLKLIQLNNIDEENYFDIDPSEFLWLIDHAEYILTDSFHGTVFSIIFRKKFIVFKRKHKREENMFGRLQNILELLGISNSIFLNRDSIGRFGYTDKSVIEKLNQQIDISLDYLEKHLKVKELFMYEHKEEQ